MEDRPTDARSIVLYPDEILGITGLLGSGRIKLALALFGLRPADGGAVFVRGRTVSIRGVRDALRYGMA